MRQNLKPLYLINYSTYDKHNEVQVSNKPKIDVLNILEKENPAVVWWFNLVDKYLMGQELEVDAISDGKTVLIPAINGTFGTRKKCIQMNSIAVCPPQTISYRINRLLLDYTTFGRRYVVGTGDEIHRRSNGS